jgi:hypothetical protein
VLTDTRAAIAAAVFLAVAPLAVRDAHYVKHDVPATLAIVVAYLAMTRVWPSAPADSRPTRSVVLAGGACGVAFSTHYYCIFLALPLAWAIFQATRADGWRRTIRSAALAGIASAAVFFALSPFIAVEPLTAWRDITANREIVVDRAVEAGAFAPAFRYLDMLWRDSMGAPVVVLALGGALWMTTAAPSRSVFLLLFPVAFFLFITNTVPASRYLNPVLPFMAIFAGYALSALGQAVRARRWQYGLALVLAATPGLIDSVRTDLFFRQTDTRTLALEFVHREVPPGSTLLVQPYSVPLTPSREGLVEALRHNLGSVEAASTKFQLQLSLTPYPAPAYRLIYLGRGGLDAEKIYVDPAEVAGPDGLRRLRELGVAFVVLKRYNDSDPGTMALLSALAGEGRLIATFSPYRAGTSDAERIRTDAFLHNTDARIGAALERPGPLLEIWQLHGAGS